MNLTGFSVVHQTNLEPGKTYFLKTRFGSGFVLASESNMDGWVVELQPDASFQSPSLKRYSRGHMMLVGNGQGTFYEPEN
jgi:hypothetical protein